MKRLILGLTVYLSLVIISPVLAINSPTLLNPSSGSTITTINLTWQAPSYLLYSGGSPYRVQIDDDQNFSLPNKDYYSTNASYSPQGLSLGTWYWRVKAKDSSGSWSDWSAPWSFTLETQSATPTPPLPDNTPTPIPSPTASKPASLFSISSIPSTINSSESFIIQAQLSGLEANNSYFLKGAFLKSGSTNYFGKTKVSEAWIKNNQSYLNQFPISTNSSGSWSGTLEIVADSEDSGFTGEGDYIFKAARYSNSGSGPNWSNQVSIYIKHQETLTPNQATDDSPPSPTAPLKSRSPSLKPTSKKGEVLALSGSESAKIPSSLQASSAANIKVSPTPFSQTKNLQFSNPFLIVGGVFMISGLGMLVYLLKRH